MSIVGGLLDPFDIFGGGGGKKDNNKDDEKTTIEDALEFDIGKTTREHIEAMSDPELNEMMLEAERVYGKQWLDLDLAQKEQLLFGTEGGQTGEIDLLGRTTEAVGDIQAKALTKQRENDILDVENLGGRATAALRASDPEMQALIQQQQGLTDAAYSAAEGDGELQWLQDNAREQELGLWNQHERMARLEGNVLAQQEDIYNRVGIEDWQATDALNRAAGVENLGWQQIERSKQYDQGLSAQQERQAAQQAREAAGARGVTAGNAAIASEILNREDFLRQNREEARTMRDEGSGYLDDAQRGRFESSMYRQGAMALRGEAQGLRSEAQGLRGEQALLRGEAQGLRAESQGLRTEEARGRAEAAQYGGQLFGMLDQTAADPFQAILGRPGQAFSGAGNVNTNAGIAANDLGSDLYDVNAGINIGLANQGNVLSYYGALAGANATKKAGMYEGLGNLFGNILKPCWVAREIYGTESDEWIMFRTWLLAHAPKWFYHLYLKRGENFAAWVSNKPLLKKLIKLWMNGRIKTMLQHSEELNYGI